MSALLTLWLAAAPVETRAIHVGGATFLEVSSPGEVVSTNSRSVTLNIDSNPPGVLVIGTAEGTARVVVKAGSRVVRTVMVKVGPPRLTEAQVGHAMRCARSEARIVVTYAPHFELHGELEPNVDPRVSEALAGVWTRDGIRPGLPKTEILRAIVVELEGWKDGSDHLEVDVDDARDVVLRGVARHAADVERIEALRKRLGFSFAVDVRLLDATPCPGFDAG